MSAAKTPLRLTYYGDDFTGSADVMESLTRSGVTTMLFVEPPTAEQLVAFPDVQAIGVAGISRALPPAEMQRELEPIFTRLAELGAPLVHYKMCSTFDSSPTLGSIGTAIECGVRAFGSRFVPLVVGAPILGRYVTFGNLFARSGLDSEPYRLDRHPTMRHHPATPMDEADIRLHLAKQTSRSMELFDVLRLNLPREEARAAFDSLLASQPDIVLFDTLYDAHLSVIGDLIWQHADAGHPLFVVGSSGVEYALTAHWREQGELPAPPVFAPADVEQTIVVSGSCSPVTDRQIGWALEHGFEEIPLDTVALLDESAGQAEIERAVTLARNVLSQGRSPILHTSRGPQDARLEPTRTKLAALGGSSGEMLGGALGRLLMEVWRQTDLPRAMVTGGDTSGYVARAMGVQALKMVAPAAPGSPLCRMVAPGQAHDGREIIFKGGQVGRTEFFGLLLRPSEAV